MRSPGLAFIAWRLATDKAITCTRDFVYVDDAQRMRHHRVPDLRAAARRPHRPRPPRHLRRGPPGAGGRAREAARRHVQDNATDLFGLATSSARSSTSSTSAPRSTPSSASPTRPHLPVPASPRYEIQQVMGREGENPGSSIRYGQDGYEVYGRSTGDRRSVQLRRPIRASRDLREARRRRLAGAAPAPIVLEDRA